MARTSSSETVNVVVTTGAGEISVVDNPTYESLTGLRDKLLSHLAQGTAVWALNYFSRNCKRVTQPVLVMQDHANRGDWEQLPLDDLFRMLLGIFPKNTELMGQSTLA